jgi:hypothetical protein
MIIKSCTSTHFWLPTMIFILLRDPALAISCNFNFGNGTPGQPFNLLCTEFNSWSEVNNELSSIECKNLPDPIYLKPSKPIILTNELNISVVASLKLISDSSTGNLNQILLHGLGGIEVYPWPSCSSCVKKSLTISFSVMTFYVNKQPPSGY